MTALLKQHILGAVTLMTAARSGDQVQIKQASSVWYANGNQIADFLHAANPHNWSKTATRTMMKTHLDQTLSEAQNRLTGHYAADIRDYDAVHKHILVMADELSAGIVKQFPPALSLTAGRQPGDGSDRRRAVVRIDTDAPLVRPRARRSLTGYEPRPDHGPPALPSPVIAWRRERLLSAGFAMDLAAELAIDSSIDLHAVLGLVDRGCPPDLAVRTIAPRPEDWARWSS